LLILLLVDYKQLHKVWETLVRLEQLYQECIGVP